MKTGYKTTEFWLAVLTSIVTLLNQSGLLGEYTLPTEAILTIGGIVITYILGRSGVKALATPYMKDE